jgi:large subunit ribosomal protein L3
MTETAIGLVGRKCGMTRIFTEAGDSIPVTVIEVQPNRITQVKTPEVDGYRAVQVTTGEKKASRLNKAITGHYAKSGVKAGIGLWEAASDQIKVGLELTVQRFKVGQMVDVAGVSRGKGFKGCISRWHFTMGDATHGNSLSHRAPGSIGQRQSPGRVFKGKKMSGQTGNEACTVQNQEIIRVDVERNLLLIRGAIPGAPGGVVMVFPAIKEKA